MEIRTLAQVLENVSVTGKARLADPVHALSAHLDQRAGATTHPRGHEVATDARQRTAVFGYLRVGVVRTTGTEKRQALDPVDRRGRHRASTGSGKFGREIELGKFVDDAPRHD